MNEQIKPRRDETTKTVEKPDREITLDDLKPTSDVNGGYVPKANDVTLKRGVID